MLSVVTMIIWGLFGYFLGWEDGTEGFHKGIIKLVAYFLAAAGLIIVVTMIMNKE